MARSRREIPEPAAPNLTPMIDVTFLLIIFFMVVSELSTLQVDRSVRLPDADTSTTQGPEYSVVLNVDRRGGLSVGGRRMAAASFSSWLEAQVARAGARRPSILIRADTETPFGHISRILQVCSRKRIAIRQVSFGAALPESRR